MLVGTVKFAKVVDSSSPHLLTAGTGRRLDRRLKMFFQPRNERLLSHSPVMKQPREYQQRSAEVKITTIRQLINHSQTWSARLKLASVTATGKQDYRQIFRFERFKLNWIIWISQQPSWLLRADNANASNTQFELLPVPKLGPKLEGILDANDNIHQLLFEDLLYRG